MVNVNKENFLEESDKLLEQLKNAKFCALDLEMTGIRDNSDCPMKKPRKCDTPEERYDKIRTIPERYGIIQIGISLFLEDEDNPQNAFVAHNYNFYLFPCNGGSSFGGRKAKSSRSCTKDIALSPSSIHFLAQHDMDFNYWINKGIPYVTVEEESHLLEQFFKRHQEIDEKQKTNLGNGKDRKSLLEPTVPDDIRFIARTMAGLREWIDASAPTQENAEGDDDTGSNNSHSLVLPPCNAFLRKCLYDTIEFEYPSLLLEKAESSRRNSHPHHQSQIRVLRLDPAEKQKRLKQKKKLEWERLQKEEIGWTRIFRALSQANHGNHQNDNATRQVPIIVHNGLMDLMFLLSHFHSQNLPRDYFQLKSTIRNYFPLLYDTKVIATEHFNFNQIRNNNASLSQFDYSTVLGDLFNNFCVTNINETTNDSSTVVHDNINNNADDAASDGNSISKFNIPIIEVDTLPTTHPESYITSNQPKLHEAAYDAYMTGCVFYALCDHIVSEKICNQVDIQNYNSQSCCAFLDFENFLRRKLFGCNKIYLMQTLYTMDLETEYHGVREVKEDQEELILLPQDPLNRQMSYTTTYCVSGINFPIHTRDIARALMNVVDSGSEDESTEESSIIRRVSFEIIWVDDTTVLVATRCPPQRSDLLNRHGDLILAELRRRFVHQSITSLKDFLSQKIREQQQKLTLPESMIISNSTTNENTGNTDDTTNSNPQSLFRFITNSVWNVFSKDVGVNEKKRRVAEVTSDDNLGIQNGSSNKRRKITS